MTRDQLAKVLALAASPVPAEAARAAEKATEGLRQLRPTLVLPEGSSFWSFPPTVKLGVQVAPTRLTAHRELLLPTTKAEVLLVDGGLVQYSGAAWEPLLAFAVADVRLA